MNVTMHTSEIKKAELLSSFSAGILGAGIALLLASQLAPYAFPILLLGLIFHAAGMFRKHGLAQTESVSRIWWVEVLYWFCWAALAGLLLFVIARQL